MIRIIYRCLTESKLTEKKWNGHFAFMHLREFHKYRKVFLNGKPLKWYNRFKNGDVIEVIDTPHEIFSGIGAAIFAIIGVTTASTAAATTVGVIAYLGIMAAISFGISALTGAFAGRGGSSATTQNKEYSSTTQPELRGASNDISNDIIPVVFGRTQQTPSYAQTPYRLVQDGASTNKYRSYFIPNYNNVLYSDFKLGETSLNNYSVDYITLSTESASETFIGFENCKAITIDEELSYNPDDTVRSTASYGGDTALAGNGNPTNISYAINLKFDNVTLSSFTDKKFEVTLEGTALVTVGGTQRAVTWGLTDEFTVTSSDLTQTSDYYTSSFSKSLGVPSIGGTINSIVFVKTTIEPTAYTRQSAKEIDDKLDVTAVSETVTITGSSSTGNVADMSLNQSLNYYQGALSEVIQTSPDRTTEIDIIISFPQGLYRVNKNNGNRISRTTVYEVNFKTEGGAWQPISNADEIYLRDINGVKQPLSSSTTTVEGANITVHSPEDLNFADQLFFRPIGFSLPEGKYSVRVRTGDFTTKTNYDVGSPACSEIQFRCNGNVINPIILPNVNQIAFEATAYKGLSGTLKKFNYIAQAQIPVWNGTDWNTTNKSSNPAAIIRYLLTDERVNPRAEKLSHIDNDSLVEYYEWCEQSGYKADGIVAEACKIGEIINAILQNSQAAMIPLYNGKHTFAVDKGNKIPVGLFNMHNSWNFKWTPIVGRQIEAIRASFVENDDWTEDELTLYWYNGQINDEPEFGKTDSDYEMIKKEYKYVCDRNSVRQIVAYELETIQTKRNQFEFTVNLEALNMMLLDRVYISNTTNMRNESTGLIKSVITSGANMTGFQLYSPVEIPQNAKITIRSLDYDNEKSVINIFEVINSGESDVVQISPIPYDGTIKGAGMITGIKDRWHYDGDLFSIGQETIYDCTITDIKYNDDGTATITARDYGFAE